jgi:hypothetical protein
MEEEEEEEDPEDGTNTFRPLCKIWGRNAR